MRERFLLLSLLMGYLGRLGIEQHGEVKVDLGEISTK
jgi:hypothetical protein